jgi:hypothetical protein
MVDWLCVDEWLSYECRICHKTVTKVWAYVPKHEDVMCDNCDRACRLASAYACPMCMNAFACSKECRGALMPKHRCDSSLIITDAVDDLVVGAKRGYKWRSPKYRKDPPDVSAKKAREILRHGEARGRKLSTKQKRFFGTIIGRARAIRSRAAKK